MDGGPSSSLVTSARLVSGVVRTRLVCGTHGDDELSGNWELTQLGSRCAVDVQGKTS